MKNNLVLYLITGMIIFLLPMLGNTQEIALAQSPTPTPTPLSAELPGAIDLTLSIYKDDISTEGRRPYEEILGYFADAIYEMSNGAHKIRLVTIYEDGKYTDIVDVVWRAEEWPRAHVSGYGLAEYQVIMGDVFPFSAEKYPALDPANWRCTGYSLGHEWGHYYYGLYDEYSSSTSADSGRLNNSSPRSEDIPVQNSVMNDQWIACNNNDFNWLNFSVAKYQTGRNAQYRVYGASGWETLARSLWEDPRSAARYAVRERTYFPELANVAPIGDQDASS